MPPALSGAEPWPRRRRSQTMPPPSALRVRPASDGLVKRLTHDHTIRVDTGPELDIDSSLVEQHAAAVESSGAGLTRPLQKRRVGRIGDDVTDREAHRDYVEGKGHITRTGQAQRCGIHDDGGGRRHGEILTPLNGGAGSGCLSNQQIRNLGCLRKAAIGYPDLSCSGKCQLDGYRARRASSAENENPLSRRFGKGAQGA